MQNQINLTNRTVYFDYMRVAALFFITLIHASAYCWYYTDMVGFNWLVLTGYKCVNRPPLLLFIMMSGALFLGREIPIKTLYTKYILRLVVAFLFWNLIYSVYKGAQWGITGICNQLLEINYHFWFLLAIIGLYICIPLLKKIANNRKITGYFLLVSGLFGFIIPSLYKILMAFGNSKVTKYTEIFGGHIYNMNLNMFMGYAFFYLLGFYLTQTEIKKKIRIVIYVMGILGAAAEILLTNIYSKQIGSPQDYFCDCFMFHEMIGAMALFIFFQYNIKGAPKLNGFMSCLSKYSFGVYLIHDLILRLIYDITLKIFGVGVTAEIINPLFGVPLLTIVVLIIGFAISALLNKIPVVKKYIV